MARPKQIGVVEWGNYTTAKRTSTGQEKNLFTPRTPPPPDWYAIVVWKGQQSTGISADDDAGAVLPHVRGVTELPRLSLGAVAVENEGVR